jgi:uncharacterized protein YfdQ (DUF2303 family)
MDIQLLDAAIKAGKESLQLTQVEGYKPALTAPFISGGVTHLAPERLSVPRFLTGSPVFNEVKAFIDYVNQFKLNKSHIFYDDQGKFLCVLDYHQAINSASHGDHVAELRLLRSPEWTTWASKSEQPMEQQAFAEFVEDNARDILTPGPAEMMAVATGLHATVGATFRQAINQANGTIQVQWDEQIAGTVRGSDKEIPSQFSIGVRPFMGTERYPIDCRLRYRVAAGNLRLHYKAMHLTPITEAALEAIVKRITDETAIAPALGKHDAAAFKRGE